MSWKHLVACREYRACVQRKKRNFRHKNVQHVTQIFVRDKAKLWKALDRMSNTFRTKNGPDRDMFANHFESLSKSPSACHFNKEYERQALDFLKRYDSGELDIYMKQNLVSQIVNENFTPNEIHRAINSLKSNKSPGLDRIPAEFLKYCKDVLLDDIQYLFNYIIDNQNFPETWAEGLRNPVYKTVTNINPKIIAESPSCLFLKRSLKLQSATNSFLWMKRLRRLTKQTGPMSKVVGHQTICLCWMVWLNDS